MSGQVVIELLDEDSKNTVIFKEDGGRFDTSQTLKMRIDTGYIVRISCKDELKTEEIAVNGEKVAFTKTTSVENYVYEATMKTEGIAPSKKGKRDVLTLQIPLEHSLLVPLQCKYYKLTGSSYSSWGSNLKNIIVNYKLEDGLEGMRAVVVGTKFRSAPAVTK